MRAGKVSDDAEPLEHLAVDFVRRRLEVLPEEEYADAIGPAAAMRSKSRAISARSKCDHRAIAVRRRPVVHSDPEVAQQASECPPACAARTRS